MIPAKIGRSAILPILIAICSTAIAEDYIWKAPTTPSPLPVVRLTPGGTKSVNLRHSAGEGFLTFLNPTLTPDTVGTVTISGESLTVSATAAGTATIRFTARNENGDQREVAEVVVIDAMPTADFSYKPPAGQSPKSVSVAGSFNGWSPAADPMKATDDGIFRITKALQPGRQEYKFVVDGEWVSDPANKAVNEADHGNSILTVTGEMTGKFTWVPISAEMPNAGNQGAFHAILPPGKRIAGGTLTVIVNNRLLDKAEYGFDAQASTVTLHISEKTFDAENFVSISGKTEDGAMGAAVFPLTFKSAQRSPRDEVIYFAFTDRFADGDPSINKPSTDDRIIPLTNYQGGDWAGITKKIEEGYFTDLGVTTIWLSPVNKNTQKIEQESVPPGRFYTSYHGYWPISFSETNEQFGSLEDLKKLIATAHEHKIAVLLDFVSNHVHRDHPLFVENPKIATPLDLPDGKRNIRLYDAYPITTWFDTFLPDIDYEGNPNAIPTVVDSAVSWLERTDADGFRHDAVKHVSLPFWEALTNKIDARFLNKDHRFVYQIGETISGYPTVAQYVGPNLLTGQFDFPTYFTLQNVLAKGGGTMSDLAQSIRSADSFYSPESIMSPLLGNHDVVRFMAFADGDIPADATDLQIKEIAFGDKKPFVDDATSYKKLQLAFAYLIALPAPPTLYYGDEIGMTGAGDPDNRRPMQWSGLAPEQSQTHDIVSRLNKVRGKSIALRRGATQILHESDERLVVARIAPEQVVIVAMNRKPTDTTLAMTLPDYWGEKFTVTELVSSGLKATLKNRSLILDGGEYSFGIWEIKF